MIEKISPSYFQKILVPIIYGYEGRDAITVAQMVGALDCIHLVGFVGVAPGESLSTAALPAQQIRNKLVSLERGTGLKAGSKVRVSHKIWEEIIQTVQEEDPDLLILEWPEKFDALCFDLDIVLKQSPCHVAVVRGPFKSKPSRVLIPLRGGPNAELALRFSLAIYSKFQPELTSIHLTSDKMLNQHDAPFQGLARVLSNLPEIDRIEMSTEDPAKTLLVESNNYDLVVMGVSAQPADVVPAVGEVAQRMFLNSSAGVIAVKNKRPMPAGIQSESAGISAISVLVDKWFGENTFSADEFKDLLKLIDLKHQQELKISLALPALNEEETIGKVITTLKRTFMEEVPLVDEIVVMDSNSTDSTRSIAQELGVSVYIHQDILPRYGSRCGKGEALWKSLYVTSGDILLWVDTDIVNIHPRFIYGLLGALLSNPHIQFVKGYYRRPMKVGEHIQAGGGGRVTELTARPLLNLFYPELSGVIQPLSGEYGGRRSALERLSFFSGYGVEIGLLIDIFEGFGLDAIAQVDLLERIHHNQPLEALSKMSFAIIQAVFRKLERRHAYHILEEVNKTMKLIRYEPGRLFLEVDEIAEKERPPMVSLPEYQDRILLKAQRLATGELVC